MKNDWKTQHVVCSSDKCVLKMINRNSSEFVSQSNLWNLIKQKLCDFITVFKYHKNLWLSNIWQNDACSADQENFRTVCEINKSIYDWQNFNFNAVRY